MAADLFDQLCAAAVDAGASDMFFHEGRVPRARVGGQLVAVDAPPLGADFFDDLWRRCGAGTQSDFDTSLLDPGGRRFRINLLRTMGARAAVLRRIRSELPDLDALGVPAGVLRGWCGARQGLVLVCGPAGSGKSTTLAALLGWMNTCASRHIVTIEDPVEFAFTDGTCLFTQREVGVDTPSFAEGLRRLLRQNPDVILIGEIRDAATAQAAIMAAETGHLVLSTLHSPDCPDAIERLEGLFTTTEREGLRRALAGQLLGIVCQKLLPATDGSVALACEYVSNTGAARKYLLEGRAAELADFIARGDGKEARAMLDAIAALTREGRISEDVARSAVANPQELQRALRGVNSASAATRR